MGWSSSTSSVALHFPRSNPPSSLPQFEVFSQNVTDNQGSLTINVLLCLYSTQIFWKLLISELARFHISQHRLNLASVSLRFFFGGCYPTSTYTQLMNSAKLFFIFYARFWVILFGSLDTTWRELKNMHRIILSFFCRHVIINTTGLQSFQRATAPSQSLV